ncbi:MAG: hypothetical protein ACO1QR_13590 [Chthoniobacteraceae bacterium]
MRRWAGTDGPTALAAAGALDDPAEREACAAQVLQGWSEKEPLAAFEHLRVHGVRDQQTISQLLYNIGQESPQAAVEWVQSLDDSGFARWAPKVVELWARSDPIAALEFASQNGVGLGPSHEPPRTRFNHDSLRRTGGSSVESVQPLAVALREHPKETLEWILNLPPGPDRDRIVDVVPWSAAKVEQSLALFPSMSADAAARAARTIASRFDSLEAGRDWAESLPPGKVRENAWVGVGSQAEHLFDLPRGVDRDAMLKGLAFSSTGLNDPVFALDHSLMIDDPILREDTFENVMQFASEHQTTKVSRVRQWLDNANIPETWKARWRPSLHETEP